MTKGNLIRCLLIPLAAVVLFWLGGYTYFRLSDDWQEIRRLLVQSPAIASQVGQVSEITVSPMPFTYSFSGDSARATLRITVVGSSGEYRAVVEAKKRNGVWSISS